MNTERMSSQVKNGLRTAVAWILGIAWVALVFAGMAVAFSPSPHSPALGWVLLAIAAVVCIGTMDRWAKYFPAILAYGVIGGLFTIATGHAVNSASVRVSRFDGVLMTLLIGASAAVSLPLGERRLRLADRIAIIAFIFCIFWQVVEPRVMLVALSIGLGCLFAAWAFDRIQRRRSPSDISRQVPGTLHRPTR